MKQTAVKIVHKDYYMLLSSMAMQRTYNKALPPYKECVVSCDSLFVLWPFRGVDLLC